jgi:hypothetical protein
MFCGDYGPKIAALQKDTPFKIMFPTYYPKGIKPCLRIFEPEFSREGNREILNVTLLFFESGTNNFVRIEEADYEDMADERDAMEHYHIEGVTVLKNSSVVNDIEESDFWWTRNKASYFVNIVGYSQKECLKTIRSMFTYRLIESPQ